MGWTGAVVLLLLFGLSIFIVPSEGVTSCVQCGELHEPLLEGFWKQAGGVIGCENKGRTPCDIGLLSFIEEYVKLLKENSTTNIKGSYDYFAKGTKKGRQSGDEGSYDPHGGCLRVYSKTGLGGDKAQLWMGCVDQEGPRNPCPSRSGCISKSHDWDPFRPARPSDMNRNVITCACMYEGCNPSLKYELNDDDQGGCGVDALQGPLKISLFLGLTLARLL